MVEGVRGVRTALTAGAPLDVVYVSPGAEERCPDVLDACVRRGIRVAPLAPGVMDRVADTVTPQPVLAVARMPTVASEEIDPSLVVVLVDVREPGNAGTILRSAEAAGASAVIFCRGSVDPYAPKVVRASAGALFHVPVVKGARPSEVLGVLARRGVRRVGTAARGGLDYEQADWSPPCALVLGNEAWGLPREIEDAVDDWVTIPMVGRSESLNVAMAASVLLFEARRHRRRATGSGEA